MNRDRLILDYYERLVETDNKKLNKLPASLKERAYFEQGLFHHRAILHILRSKAGLAVCCGAIDCFDIPASDCMSGEHTVCYTHSEKCYLCEALTATS